jgi:hypothetical protein
MLGLGPYNPFPLTFGGDESVEEIEHESLLGELAPAYDTEEGTASHSELIAYAQLLAGMWAMNERLRNQALPRRMLDVLTDWETILRLTPESDATDVSRRAGVAAKLLAFASNAIVDIRAAIVALMGSNFDDLVFVDPADEVTYWPAVNPGPPGFEWMSNRAVLGVRINRSGLSDNAFYAKRAALAELLDGMLPAWMTYEIGIGSSFVVNVGTVGSTFL